jgi:hypothetical protein
MKDKLGLQKIIEKESTALILVPPKLYLLSHINLAGTSLNEISS